MMFHIKINTKFERQTFLLSTLPYCTYNNKEHTQLSPHIN